MKRLTSETPSKSTATDTYILYGFAAVGAGYIGVQIGRVLMLLAIGEYPH